MQYRIEFQTTIRTEATEVIAQNESFARASFYEIYNRMIQIVSITEIKKQAA